jgi:glutamate-ammonia-ligase adenylyltransferase
VALADLGGVWSLQTVTQAWTDLADACLAAALQAHVAREARRGKIPGQTEEDAHRDGAGMVALAMGKMGAGELNYSSDIDLICLFDETRFDPGDEMEARAGFIRATRRIAATLGETTGRRAMSFAPTCACGPMRARRPSASPWPRRSATTRPRGGPGNAPPISRRARRPATSRRGSGSWRPCNPSSGGGIWTSRWCRTRWTCAAASGNTRASTGPATGIVLEGHNIKLGAGGIREIEFFAQTRQLVAGGRDPSLRDRRTVKALAALARADWITRAQASDLAELYAHHREIEHRLQMIDDAQTHTLPKSDEGFDRLARFCGEGDTQRFREGLEEKLRRVETVTGAFFAPLEVETQAPEIGAEASAIVARWPGYPALRSARGQEIFERLKPGFLASFDKAAKPLEALQNFDGFLRGLPAGVQLFSMFEANPQLVDLIVDISATAPRLSRYLSRHSAVLDAVLDGRFFAPWPGRDALVAELRDRLDGEDYEQALDAARRWQHEWHFRIGVHQLRGLITPETAGRHYTNLADAVVIALWPLVCTELAKRHGPAPGRGGAVIAMGSLGAGQMTATSDLDLITIYDAQGVEYSEGRRPLDPRAWFAKATKSLVAALSAPTAAGTLYEVDMRLRPSGRQGPVATALASFERYQREEAWTWEHMALTRARVLAGEPSLAADIEAVRCAVIAEKGDRAKVAADAGAMRARLAEAGRAAGVWTVKDGPGGMQDIELLAQAGALIAGATEHWPVAQLEAAAHCDWIPQDHAQRLSEAYRLFARVHQSGRLLSDEALDPETVGAGGRAFLSEQACWPDANSLASALENARAEALTLIDKSLPPPTDTQDTEDRDA